MKKVHLFAALLGILLVTGCGSKTNETSTTSIGAVTASTKASLPVLIGSKDELVTLASQIAYDSKDPEAYEIANWLALSAFTAKIAKADNDQIRILKPRWAEIQRLPIILVGSDAGTVSKRLGDWYKSNKHQGEFTFFDKQPVILIRAQNRNDFDFGKLLLHEGRHSRRALIEKILPKTDEEAATEEVGSYELEHRVASSIGGEPYRALIDAEKARQADALITKDANDAFSIHVLTPLNHKKELDEIFGPCGTTEEQQKRDGGIWRQAIFEMITAKFPNKADADTAKQLFYWKFERTRTFHEIE